MKFFLLLMAVIFAQILLNAQTIPSFGYLIDEENVGIDLDDVHVLYVGITSIDTLENELIDASFVLSQEEIIAWGDYSVSVRFRNIEKENFIDARNGGAFTKDDSIAFNFNQLYHCWIEMDVPAQTYSVYIETEGISYPALIAENYAFRNTNIAMLSVWSCMVVNPGDNFLRISDLALVGEIGEKPGTNTSIADTRLPNSMGVNIAFPNPFNQTFKLDIEGNFEYKIYSPTGNLVENGFANGSCNIGESLIKGIYFLQVSQKNQKEKISKIIKY
jgi:hypothetical protein